MNTSLQEVWFAVAVLLRSTFGVLEVVHAVKCQEWIVIMKRKEVFSYVITWEEYRGIVIQGGSRGGGRVIKNRCLLGKSGRVVKYFGIRMAQCVSCRGSPQ